MKTNRTIKVRAWRRPNWDQELIGVTREQAASYLKGNGWPSHLRFRWVRLTRQQLASLPEFEG